MAAIGKVITAIAAGIAFYAFLFGIVIDKPLSVGIFDRVYSAKRAYGDTIEGPKIIVAAGSSGFYSVRCEVIEKKTGTPCVNISIALALGRETILEQVKQVAKPNDTILLPWEFRMYFLNADEMRARISFPYIIRHEKQLAPALGFDHFFEALFYFDLKYLFNALAETSRYMGGHRHGFDKKGHLTTQGDYQGHTANAGEKFRDKLDGLRSSVEEMPKIASLETPPSRLMAFFKWAEVHNIRVLGTLPPSFNTIAPDQKAIDKIRSWYAASDNADFFVLDNLGQYPKDCFYDTREHLNEECQIIHTQKIAAALSSHMLDK